MNNFALFYGSQSLFSIELTHLNLSVLVQSAIIKIQIFVRRKMKRKIFTSDKNFKSILNQLGYFKGQLLGSLIIKYEFSSVRIFFDLIKDQFYQKWLSISCIASQMLFSEYEKRKMSTNRNLFCKIPMTTVPAAQGQSFGWHGILEFVTSLVCHSFLKISLSRL